MRIRNSPLPSNSRNPVLLPAKHPFVMLVIRDAHEAVKHSGIRDTLTTLRERFSILRGREAVKQFIRRCVIWTFVRFLTRLLTFPAKESQKTHRSPMLVWTLLDCCSFVTYGNSEGANDSSKVHVCLFTSASTRAVHLEMTRGLGVQAFLIAFRRFTTRRGLPATLNSDNAKAFKSSCKEIRKITRAEEVWRFLSNKRVNWNFIIDAWWRGYWERLVQMIKRPLKKIFIGRTTLTFDELRTILVEIEGVINARLITYLYDDEDSISYPLTLSDLIYGRRSTSTPNVSHQEIISTCHSFNNVEDYDITRIFWRSSPTSGERNT